LILEVVVNLEAVRRFSPKPSGAQFGHRTAPKLRARKVAGHNPSAGSREPTVIGLLIAVGEAHDPQPKRGIAQAYDLSMARCPVV